MGQWNNPPPGFIHTLENVVIYYPCYENKSLFNANLSVL